MTHLRVSLFMLLVPAMAGAAPVLKGLWKFDDPGNPDRATVGAALAFQGTPPVFSASIADDGGAAMTGCITTAANTAANRIIATHGISPNGGGVYVNDYTIVADVLSPAASRTHWRAILQTNQGNANDADFFIRDTDDKLGVGVLGYSSAAIDETRWKRLVVSFKNGAGNPIVSYVDGAAAYTHVSQGLDGRHSLDPTVLFFSDENGDNWPVHVGLLAIYEGALTASEVAMVGSAGAEVPLSLDPFPGAPRDLAVTVNPLSTSANLAWTAAEAAFGATGIRVFRNGAQIAELPLTASSHADPLPGGSTIQEFTYQVKTYGGAVGDSVPPLQATALWNPAGVGGGLVAYYRFENNIADSAPDGVDHPGAVSGASPRFVADGRTGAGVEFDDTASPHQMITLGNPAALQFGTAQDFSVAFWFKHPFDAYPDHSAFGGSSGYSVIAGNKNFLNGANRGWVVSIKPDGAMTFNISDGTSRRDATIGAREGINAISDGFWHHMAISCDRDGMAICYLDGRNIASVSLAGLGSVDPGLVTAVGCDGTLGTNPYWFNGSLDELAIWRRVLTADDISLMRSRGLSGQALTGSPVVDSDNDGLPDGWEQSQFGNLTENGNGDFDGDGLSNRMEFAGGTSAAAAQPDTMTRIAEIPLPGGAPGEKTRSVSYRRGKSATGSIAYNVEHSTNGSTWSGTGLLPLGAPVNVDANTDEVSVYVPAALNTERRLFRVRATQQYQGVVEQNLVPRVEYTSAGILVTWTTAEATATILEYGANRQFSTRYEDWNLTTQHSVLLTGFGDGDDIALAVVSLLNGIETRSQTFSTETASSYAPAKIVDQAGYVTGGLYAQLAADILTATGIRKGHALDAGSGDGKLAYELARQSDGLIVTCLETDPVKVQASRSFLTQRGVYGSRVRVFQVSSLTSGLRFRKGTFNLITSEANLTGALDLTQTTALRNAMQDYLEPARGKSYFNMLANALPEVSLRPPVAYAGKWTTNYGDGGNTSYGGEALANATKASDLVTQWVGRPDAGSNVERQVRAHIPLAANGRFYCPCDDEIVTVDSRNGFILWSKQMPGFNRFNMMRDGGNMVCDDDALYVAIQGRCLALDGETGNTLTEYAAPAGPRSSFTYYWGYVGREATRVLGTAVKDDAFYTSHFGWDNWFDYESGYGTDQVCADNIFARDKTTGTQLWKYQNGLILNMSVTLGGGKVFFLESRSAPLAAANSRRLGMSALKPGLFLVCLDSTTGALQWEQPMSSLSGGTPTITVQYSNSRLLLTTADGGPDRFYLYGLNPANGAQIWTQNHAWAKADHGGATQHPVIVDDKVWIEPRCYNLQTGALLTGTAGVPSMPGRPACSTWAGGKNFLVYRGAAGRIQYGGNVNMWAPGSSLTTGWTRIRTSCWISAIPADGMILNKEGGGGCSCGAWMETSVGFAPPNP